MADNVAITPGVGATIAADDVGGIMYQVMKLAVGADGAAALVDAANPVPVSAPASQRTTHHIGVSPLVDSLMSGYTALPVKFIRANVAASQTDNVLIAAIAGKVLLVVLFRLSAGATATAVTFNSKPAGAGVAITESFTLGINDKVISDFSPVGHFKTTVSEGLTVTTGAGSTTGIGLAYVEV